MFVFNEQIALVSEKKKREDKRGREATFVDASVKDFEDVDRVEAWRAERGAVGVYVARALRIAPNIGRSNVEEEQEEEEKRRNKKRNKKQHY